MSRGVGHLVLAALLLAAVPAAAQDTYVAVIVGLGGDPEHAETFQRWGASLVDHASTRLAIPRERIIYLMEDPAKDPARATGKSTKAEITGRLTKMGAAAKPDDVAFIMLIGHGTADPKQAKFNLPGPDMTAADFDLILDRFAAKHIVFVNSTSASGPFIEPLAAPGRVIVTATRSHAEHFATLFGGYFVDALASDEADGDKNKRVSVLEAFTAAKAQVARVYTERGIMLTERALLEDGGDGEGSLEPAFNAKDGSLAGVVSLGAPAEALALPEDPALRKLYEERRALERRAEALKLLKASMAPSAYAAELEKVMIDLARKSQEIRAIEGKGR